MIDHNQETISYIYNYSYPKDETSLCALEMRAFFGYDSESDMIESDLKIDPSRSPFIRERIDVIFDGNTLEEIKRYVEGLQLLNMTFKVVFVNNPNVHEIEKVRFTERREIERDIGLYIPGEPDLINPDLLFAIMHVGERWIFGKHNDNEAIWLHHQQKPNGYSTALSTRVARAVANIAVPNPDGIKAIDPCCGIGTVLVEGLSMGIDIVGSDINRLIIPNVKENIAHFGLAGDVSVRDIRDITGNYDVAIIDMPYNLCSVLTVEEQLEMLESTRNFAKKVIIVTVEQIDTLIQNTGFSIVDRGIAKKGTFVREIIVCE
ncbi:TRM11 family SAM-dependent methyltransferase [Aquibacillus rhizosphaerae]|uniref:RsmD family RNA methyltransferase n=1 Tax=Aquibacillus rhizosphaerae TaxID=3051431 RepID=A0ABT7L8W2_9BACI|nr:RsmD family RNA methyltransferase [Aquibacillus sp. LR5S19]MDL4842298.1 RsmD family RNA methyltransferase [Aquibacillus sp. LR5S19]